MMKLLWLAVLCLVCVEGHRILCVFPVPSPSHDILGKGVVRSLLEAGHEVYWATPYPDKVKPTKNLNVIDVSATQEVFASVNISDFGGAKIMRLSALFGEQIVSKAALAPDMVAVMQSKQFDAVITEWFMSDVPAGYAAVLGVPWIMLSSITYHPYLEVLMGDLTSTSVIPVMLLEYKIPMGFWARVGNTIFEGALKLFSWYTFHSHSSQYHTLFGPLAASRGALLPPFSSVYNNVSVLLVNAHPSLAPAQLAPPNVVDIGGFHVEDAALTKDLQDLMDSSPQGVVFFSFGSVVKVSTLSQELKGELVSMLGELPYTVLWRSDEELENLPPNVHVRKWLPQTGILAHPNVKLFISHCGLLSLTEAVHYGVPVLAVPVFGDQPNNAERAVEAGYALKVDFAPHMAGEMRKALKEMVYNDTYYKTVKQVSKLYHKRPVPPSKLISHYVELAIESKGAFHLRSNSRHYQWYQLYKLDQLLVAVLFFYSLYLLLRTIVRKIRSSFRDVKKKTN